MTRPVAILIAVVALLVPAAFAASPATASEQRPTLAELEGEVMCPTCHTPLDQSDSPIADRIRAFIRARIRAGDTKSEIKQRLVQNFGPAILAAPPKRGFDLLAWLLPLVGLGGGALVLGAAAWRWTRARERDRGVSDARAGVPPELERRLDEELARFET